MQVMPGSPFLMSQLHQQIFARGLQPAPSLHPGHPTDPATPPSSEDNMSPPPTTVLPFPRIIGEDELADKQVSQPAHTCSRLPTPHFLLPQAEYNENMKRDFKCPLCSEKLTGLKDFTAHLRGHNEVKPTNDPSDPTGQAKVYHCCLCGKMLSSFSSLDRHMLVHSGERPFSCEICAQTFTTNGNMHRHRRTHNDVRQSCESDGSAGSASKKIRKRKAEAVLPRSEKLVKEGQDDQSTFAPLKCPICSDPFFSELSMEVHIISLHPGKEIKCEECQHPCPSYNYFKLHKNMFHFKIGMSPGFGPLPPQPYNGNLSMVATSQEKSHHSPAPLIIPSHLSSLSPLPMKREAEERENADIMNSSFCSDAGGQQDDDPVLKEMKLKGEFPCRLCPAVFPNLRALKGHNKEHLLAPPFECNVGTCRYNTSDKSNLLQHMRGHTGQKPFECKICNFGFTTKANCERHVKNKHNKNSKEDVREHIIIHEGGDDESNPYTEQSRDSFLIARPDPSHENDLKPTPTIFPPTPPRNHSAFIPYRPFELEKETDVKIKSESGEEAPLDLSRAAKTASTPSGEHEKLNASSPFDLKADAKDNNNLPYLENLCKKNGAPPMPAFPTNRFPFNLPFLAGSTAAPLWPPGLGLAGINPAAFPFNPMHLAALLAAKNEEFKKQTEQALQAKESAAAHLQSLNQMQELASPRGLLTLSQISPTNSSLSTISPQNSPQKSNMIPSEQNDSNYKMVIKNGILMRKQKQRRYRTERPYGCDQCTARFTLRSNMDRHMKQQHADTYSQKPRKGPGRKPGFQEDELVSSGPPNAKEEDLELIRKEEAQKDGFESEEEEGYLDEEEDEHGNLIIDDNEEGCLNPDGDQNFRDISKFFNKEGSQDFVDIEAGSESSGGLDDKKMSAYSAAPHRMNCPFCSRKFPWSSSLKRHILTHTGQKPYKCTECPLWFTTKSNCDRHIIRKHGNNNNSDIGEDKDFDDEDEELEMGFHYSPLPADDQTDFPTRRDSTTDSPYKCHICDDGFTDRLPAIQHIEVEHPEEFQSLTEKKAFDAPEEVVSPQTNESGEELYDQLRGKFPDYVNRKIICLFCSRKFWSAEDLRRHVRTHTGETPYACEICHRRFTLKHSMLRHKKKHFDSGISSNGEATDDDTLSNHSSSGLSDNANVQAPVQVGYDKKRANLGQLMEKISRLNSTTEPQS